MAIKGSRKINVRGQDFSWKFKPHKDDCTNFGASPRFAHVAVQLNHPHSGKMVAWIESSNYINADVHDGDTGHIRHVATFGPADVRLLIESALDLGWEPLKPSQYDFPPGTQLSEHRTVQRG